MMKDQKSLSERMIELYEAPEEDWTDEDFDDGALFWGIDGLMRVDVLPVLQAVEAAVNLYGMISVSDLYKVLDSYLLQRITKTALVEFLKRMSSEDYYPAGLCPAEFLYSDVEGKDPDGYLIQWDLVNDDQRLEQMKQAVIDLPLALPSTEQEFEAYTRTNYIPDSPYARELKERLAAHSSKDPIQQQMLMNTLFHSYRQGTAKESLIAEYLRALDVEGQDVLPEAEVLIRFLRHTGTWVHRGLTAQFQHPAETEWQKDPSLLAEEIDWDSQGWIQPVIDEQKILEDQLEKMHVDFADRDKLYEELTELGW